MWDGLFVILLHSLKRIWIFCTTTETSKDLSSKMIFKDNSLEVSIVVQKIQILFKECRKITKRPSHIVIKEPTINQYYA